MSDTENRIVLIFYFLNYSYSILFVVLQDWDELERDAIASDRAKRKQEEENDDGGARNKKVPKRR